VDDAAERVLAVRHTAYRIVTDQDERATSTTPRSIERAVVQSKNFGLRAGAAKHWEQTRLDFGFDGNGRLDLEAEDVRIGFDTSGALSRFDTDTTIADARRLDAGVFVATETALSHAVALAAGVRFDRVRSTNEDGFAGDRSITDSEPSGHAAVTWNAAAGFSATLQYARGFRDARLSDRFFRGVTGAGSIEGNPALEAETSGQYDLALRHVTGRFHTALYVYRYRIDDLIERYERPEGSDFFFFQNRGRARFRGIEIEAQATLPAGLTLVAGASAADGETVDDGGPVDDVAPENLFVQARKALGDRARVQVRAGSFAALDEPGPNEVRLDPRTVVDGSAAWSATPKVELQLLVRNLFDEEYWLTADGRSPLAPGRSGVLTARFAL
jgi:outer membrane receptor protein involved in Fe transport